MFQSEGCKFPSCSGRMLHQLLLLPTWCEGVRAPAAHTYLCVVRERVHFLIDGDVTSSGVERG